MYSPTLMLRRKRRTKSSDSHIRVDEPVICTVYLVEHISGRQFLEEPAIRAGMHSFVLNQNRFRVEDRARGRSIFFLFFPFFVWKLGSFDAVI